MLQSFLIIKDPLNNNTAGLKSPAHKLALMGYRVIHAHAETEVKQNLRAVDAVILHMAIPGLIKWGTKILVWRNLPLLWWFDESTSGSSECRLDLDLDGMLCLGMSDAEVNWVLHLSSKHYMERTQWQQERELLLSKLEERKWIDQAKKILCDMKKISEAEAYEFLRKQAMNERKRMSDVAASIVKVFQLLQEETRGGRKK